MSDIQSCATGTLEEVGSRDHSVTSEYRIYGPPGAGKTTSLSRQIVRAVGRFGTGSVLVTSFSRAAATELVGRDLPVESSKIGTLHAHCYRALGCPAIAEAHVKEWNRLNPHLKITSVNRNRKLDGDEESEDQDSGTATGGDRALQELNRLRGRVVPPDHWPATVREFARMWKEYKSTRGLFDFCDLIETALLDFHFAPERPSVIFVDEAQDLNKMQLTLLRKWGAHCRYFIVCGDEDQTVFSFSGASPEAMLDPDIPDDHKIILKQSYRVPRAVHAAADRLIRQVTRRQEKEYLPRPADGTVLRLSQGGYKSPDYWILKTALTHLERGKTVMFLASCSYMLQPVIAVLRKNAIPFHNPYRRTNGFWNPIRDGKKKSAASRILSLLSAHPDFGCNPRLWTYRDLALWTEWLVTEGIFKPCAKAVIDAGRDADPVAIEILDQIFEPRALESLLECFEGSYRKLLDWWRRRVTATVHSRVRFPADVVMTRGPQALMDRPRVIVGTIHSVKGGEADVVFLFPDLSRSGDAAYQRHGASRDAVIRLFYVGLTRARETLYICQRESPLAVTI